MATARNITNFIASGTHAARPVTPTLLAGETAVYYETDTLHMFAFPFGGAWTQIDSVGGSVPAIVQNACVAVASHATGITLGAGPTNGNLLIALVSDQSTSPSAGAGWTLMGSASAANDGWGALWKVAGAGESATQTPCGDSHAGTISMYEISNACSGAFTAVTQFSSTPNITENAYDQKPNTSIIVGCFVVRNLANTTSISGATRDAQTTGQGRGCDNFHVAAPTQGNNAVTANYAANQGGVFIACAVG